MSNNNNDDGGAMVLMCCMFMCLCYCMCSSASSVLGTILQPTSTYSYSGMDKAWKDLGAADDKGSYTSPVYGNLGNNPMKGQCPKGSYLTDVMAFHGQGEHTNAIQGWCYDPKTQKVQRLFDAPTCGKRDRPKASNVFLDGLNAMMVAIGGVLAVIPGFQAFGATLIAGGAASLAVQGAGLADAKNNLLKGGYGRAVYDYNFLASPAGIYKWEVRPKDNEIQGLNMIGLQGDELGWTGGNRSRTWGSKGPRRGDPTGTIHKGRCAPGKIVTAITANCGDRLDGIQFTCDVPPLD
jgi:hypothetical protein